MRSFTGIVEETPPRGIRLDRYVAECLELLSRSQIKARNLTAYLNGKAVKISQILKGGEHLQLSWEEAESPLLIPENIPLDIMYEDERVVVLNKVQGMVVHPGAGNWQGTLANALLFRMHEKKNSAYCNVESCKTLGQRPGIVHRLDKDTSGVIIAAWDEAALAFLADQFKARTARKSYAALVHGCPPTLRGSIDKRIVRSHKDRKTFTVSDTEGRASLTHFKVIRTWGNYSLLLLRPKTGRTHQLRVHLKYLGNPILGDPIYGSTNRHVNTQFIKASLMLHAKSLSLFLPDCSKRTKFTTALPDRFKTILRSLNGIQR